MWSSEGRHKVVLEKQTLLSRNLFNLNCIPFGDPISWYNLKPIFVRFYPYIFSFVYDTLRYKNQNRNKHTLQCSVKVVTNQLTLFASITQFLEVG